MIHEFNYNPIVIGELRKHEANCHSEDGTKNVHAWSIYTHIVTDIVFWYGMYGMHGCNQKT